MKSRILRLSLLVCLAACGEAMAASCYDVVPQPRSVTLQKGRPFVLDATVNIVCSGPVALHREALFLQEYVQQATGIVLGLAGEKEKGVRCIELAVDTKAVAQAEGYLLTVDDARISIAGGSAAGVFHGVQTLRKSLPTGDATSVEMPAVKVSDSPRFAWRGMHLDCSRHFFGVDFVKRYLDMMALHQMNTFHWHLTDDQGWRIEIKSWPRLTEVGARRTGTVIGHNSDLDDHTPVEGHFTQQQCREIVEYARQRHITVVPEIDMPGHMLAALASYPELGCTGGPYEVGHWWGVYSDVLCAGNPRVYQFVNDVLDEVAAIFPSEVIHIGGDETPTSKWEACPRCRALPLDGKTVQCHFTERVLEHMKQLGRRALGWDELLDNDVPRSAMIMSWRGVEPGARAAQRGHDVVMTPVDYCYLNFQQVKATYHEPSLCDGYIPIDRLYAFDPCPDSLAAEARGHILGVQGNLWAEYLTSESLAEYQALPRMSALAEVQWTPTGQKDYEGFIGRLTSLTRFYTLMGWDYARHLWPERRLHSRGEF